jgi:hypothetical protein
MKDLSSSDLFPALFMFIYGFGISRALPSLLKEEVSDCNGTFLGVTI